MSRSSSFVQPAEAAELRAAIANVARALATCASEHGFELVRERAALSRELRAPEEREEAPSREGVAQSSELDGTCARAHSLRVATVVRGSYEWDADKAVANVEKHGVSFEEAASALQDPHAVYIDASTASEERLAAIGLSADARALYVVHLERGERDRIVSARLATAAERDLYAHGE